MDSAATLALLLDRVIDGAGARPDAEATTAILMARPASPPTAWRRSPRSRIARAAPC